MLATMRSEIMIRYNVLELGMIIPIKPEKRVQDIVFQFGTVGLQITGTKAGTGIKN
jgi:hypothetical protein